MGWFYLGKGYLRKNHSLNCGCNMCRMKTYFKRKDRRKDRHDNKININDIDI